MSHNGSYDIFYLSGVCIIIQINIQIYEKKSVSTWPHYIISYTVQVVAICCIDCTSLIRTAF